MNNRINLILAFLILTSFRQLVDKQFEISKFQRRGNKISLTLVNLNNDSIQMPNLFLRMNYKQKRFELRKEFYHVSYDTLFIEISNKPTTKSIETSHKIEGLFIDGLYNDYKVEAGGRRTFDFYIDKKHKTTNIKGIKIQYDNFVVYSGRQ